MATIRDASLDDAERILEIYRYYVVNTAITFECHVPSVDEFRERMKETMSRYPYIVVEKDGNVQGYAYTGPLNTRGAYDWSCEVSIYLAHDARGGGMGRMLYEELEERLKKMGILNLYACIGYPEVEDEYLTKNSVGFHAHLGYETVGRFHKCGNKFGRWYDIVWMEKVIGEHGEEQPEVTEYKSVI